MLLIEVVSVSKGCYFTILRIGNKRIVYVHQAGRAFLQFEMTGCYQTPILHYMKKPSAETTPDSHLNGTKRTKEREGGGVATGEATLVAKDDLLSSSHAQPSTPSHRSMIRGGCKSLTMSPISNQRTANAEC